MKRLLCVLCLCGLVLTGCDRDDGRPAAAPTPTQRTVEPTGTPTGPVPTFPPARLLIDTEEGSVLVDAEVAETPEQWEYGLMNRTSLPEDAGMVFLFFQQVNASFYMKDTLIPLSIAFFDDNGKILDIQDMDPCEDDPCPMFSPGEPFSGALEVNQGAFERWGVQAGDRITITH